MTLFAFSQAITAGTTIVVSTAATCGKTAASVMSMAFLMGQALF